MNTILTSWVFWLIVGITIHVIHWVRHNGPRLREEEDVDTYVLVIGTLDIWLTELAKYGSLACGLYWLIHAATKH